MMMMMMSWSLITNSVSVPWNNMRPSLTDSNVLCCHWHLQVSIHLPAFINYTSQWQMPPHSFVCSYMHGNKRIRYQSKLIYSYEDGVPTVLWNECMHSMPLTCLTAQPVERFYSPSLVWWRTYLNVSSWYCLILLLLQESKLSDDGWAAIGSDYRTDTPFSLSVSIPTLIPNY